MNLAIMQPYFMPYLGYFQLMNAVDEFVIYDDIEYTKKGWINRNRILINGTDHLFSIPLKGASDYLNIKDRFLADDAGLEIRKILNRIKSTYSKAPQFKNVYPLVEHIFSFSDKNLFNYIFNSLKELKIFIGIDVKTHISSNLNLNPSLKGKSKVIDICKKLNADVYINPIGGVELYDKIEFALSRIKLQFLNMNEIKYGQFNFEFVPSLSIIDVMMFNSKTQIKDLLDEFTLL